MKDLKDQIDELRWLMNKSAVQAHVRFDEMEHAVNAEFDGLQAHLRRLGDMIANRQGMLFSEMTRVAGMLGAAPVAEQPPLPRVLRTSAQTQVPNGAQRNCAVPTIPQYQDMRAAR